MARLLLTDDEWDLIADLFPGSAVDRCMANARGRPTEARQFPVPAESAKAH